MKKLSSLFGWLLLAGVASAAPYIVYSGSTQETVVTPSGSALKTFEVYLITDLADTTSYGILQFDAVTRQGEITIYPIANPTSVEANLNLFGSVDAAGGIGGTAVLGIGDITTDSSSNTYVSHSYATGLLTTQSTLLVPARTNTLTTGTLTFPPSTAIYSGDQPFAQTFQGTTLSYTISSTGSLTQATGQGLFSLQIDPFLTPAANIGAGNPSSLPQKAVRSTQIITPTDLVNGPITPVSTADTTVLVAYDNWLTNLATALNVTLPSTNENVGGDDGGGASLTFGGTGTGILTGGNSYEGGTIIGGGTLNIYGNTGGGLTVIGVPTTTNGGTLTVGGGTITSSGTETLTLTGTSTFTGPTTITGGTILTGGSGTLSTGSLTLNTGSPSGTTSPYILINGAGGTGGPSLGLTYNITDGTVTISSISGDTVSGTVVPSGGTTLAFSNETLVLNGSSDLSTVTPGETFTGSVTISSGTVTITTP